MRHPDEGTGRGPGGASPGGSHLDEGTIHAWLDGALDASESARVERHAAGCAACAALVAEARGLVAAASRILTRLDDVPAGVVPSSAPSSATEGARPLAAGTAGTRTVGRDVRRRKWTPAAWGLSTAAAAAIVMILVARQGFDRGALMEPAPPLGTTDGAAPEASPAAPPPADLSSTKAAPLRGETRDAADSFRTTVTAPRPSRPEGAAGAAAVESVTVGAESSFTPSISSPLQGRAAAAQVAPAEARAEADRVAPVPAPPSAGLAGVVRQERLRREGGEKVAASDVAADSAAELPSFVAVDAAANAAANAPAAEAMRFEMGPASDSATRAALPRRVGLGSRILSGARLVSSAIDTTARPLERRSIYALEDGAIVTLVERASVVALEAVVTTSAGEGARARMARPAQPTSEPTPVPAPAVAPPAAPPAAAPVPAVGAQETQLADGSRVLRLTPRETIVVRPDGLVRLEWREIGAELSLEGRVSIDRIRALKARVGP